MNSCRLTYSYKNLHMHFSCLQITHGLSKHISYGSAWCFGFCLVHEKNSDTAVFCADVPFDIESGNLLRVQWYIQAELCLRNVVAGVYEPLLLQAKRDLWKFGVIQVGFRFEYLKGLFAVCFVLCYFWDDWDGTVILLGIDPWFRKCNLLLRIQNKGLFELWFSVGTLFHIKELSFPFWSYTTEYWK